MYQSDSETKRGRKSETITSSSSSIVKPMHGVQKQP